MTLDDMAEAMNGKMKVRYGKRTGFIVDSYIASGGKTVCIVSNKPEAIASGNNVRLEDLEIVREV